MTDRLGFYIWPIIVALIITACATARNIDTAIAGQPPELSAMEAWVAGKTGVSI